MVKSWNLLELHDREGVQGGSVDPWAKDSNKNGKMVPHDGNTQKTSFFVLLVSEELKSAFFFGCQVTGTT